MTRYKMQDGVFFFWCAYPSDSWEGAIIFRVREDRNPEDRATEKAIPYVRLFPASPDQIKEWLLDPAHLRFLMGAERLTESEYSYDFVQCYFCKRWNKVLVPSEIEAKVPCQFCDAKVHILRMAPQTK